VVEIGRHGLARGLYYATDRNSCVRDAGEDDPEFESARTRFATKMTAVVAKKKVVLALCLLLALLLVVQVTPSEARNKKIRQQIKELPPQYQHWLATVDLLLTKEEIRAFLELQKDYQRDAFIESFWLSRDPYPQTTRNEFREKWEKNVEEAAEVFGDLTEDRSQILMINGYPDARIEINCIATWPLEVWYWQRLETLGMEVILLFVQKGGMGPFRIWNPSDGVSELLKFPDDEITNCGQSDQEAIFAAYRSGQAQGALGFGTLLAELFDSPESPSGEWVSTFHAYSTDLPEEAETFPAEIVVEFPNRHQTRTIVQALLAIETEDAAVSELAGFGSYNFLVTGEVLRGDKLFDRFRYRFNIATADIQGTKIPLVFERYLRPGDYEVILMLEDLNSGKLHRTVRPLTVPVVDKVAPPVPQDEETARLLAEANAAISTGENTIKIIPPRGELQTGMLRIDTMTTGNDIKSVEFSMNNRSLMSKRRPPFSVELDLGTLPRMRTLIAVARDAAGNEVARDERLINSGTHRFDISLIEPRSNRNYTNSLRAEARVEVPDGGAVEKVEIYLNETLKATLYQPPWTQPILLESANELAYVRAVAYQPDGNFVEDSVFINAPDYMENLDIQFVELYITILDKEKHPVLGLGQEVFQVFEDGNAQTTQRFDIVSNLPIHAGILLDVSGSMEESLATARLAALNFYQKVITPRDRAALMTFNDHPNLAVKFTNKMDSLAGGLAGLKAERGTALYDSIIFGLYYFNGIKGQRTLIILSDGKDEHSRFTFEDTLEYARRAGVSIYSIGLNFGKKLSDAKRKLSKLAAETGGRSFFIQDATELAEIYQVIEQELRSRYYLAYQSSNTSDDEDFRSIEVEISQSGLEAKTLRGYYP